MMKNLLLLTILATLLFSIDAQGQYDQGNIWLNGASDLKFSFGDDSSMQLHAKGGYFVSDNILAGVGVDLVESEMMLSVLGRYFIGEKFFAGLEIQGFGDSNTLFLNGGYELFLDDQLSLEPVLYFPLDSDLDPFILVGISYFFER